MTTRLYWTMGLMLSLLPMVAGALGLGAIKVDSFLNEPLDARIELLSMDGVEPEDIRVGLADAQTFAKAGLPRPFILSQLRFRVVAGKSPKQAYVKVTSRDRIAEPFLDFLVSLDWQGNHLVRQFTVLLDPRVSRPLVAPAPPARPKVAAPPAATSLGAPAGEVYGPVKRSETLWVIANRLRPKGVTVEQMMMALQRANPEAFRFGNVNYLKQGATLRVPALEQIRSITPRQARRLFREQNDAWKRLRRGGTAARARTPKPAPATAPAPSPAVTEEVPVGEGEIAPIQRQPAAPTETAPAAQGKAAPEQRPRLRVVEPDPEWVAGQRNLTEAERPEDKRYPIREAETLKEAIADSRQSLEAVREINRNLEELRGVLEQKIDTLRESLAERDRIIAQLQQRLEQMSRESAERTKTTAPATAPAPAATSPRPAIVSVESQTAVEPGQQRGPTVEQIVTWARAHWMPLALGGVVALLLLLLILLLRRRYHASRGVVPVEDPFSSYAEMEKEIRHREMGEGQAEASRDESTSAEEEDEGFFMEPGGDVASALTEADIYLAYRRYSQAEALIREAIKANPESLVLKAKLLEIYAFRKDKRRFVPYMEEVYQAMVAEAPELWAKVVAMGRNLAPEHPLINAEAATDLLADGEFSDTDEQFDLDTELQPLELDLEPEEKEQEEPKPTKE